MLIRVNVYKHLLVIQAGLHLCNYYPTINWQVDQVINQLNYGMLIQVNVFEH